MPRLLKLKSGLSNRSDLAVRWLLNAIYVGALLVLAPVLLWRTVFQGKYRVGWSQKLFGRLPRRDSDRPCVWFHAVSVGEVLLLQTVIEQFTRRYPSVDVVISTTTVTGMAVARDKFPGHPIRFFPLDFSWAVRNAIRRIRPLAVVLVELELWPNFILEAKRSGVPLALINGRLGERSYHGYQRIGSLVTRLWNAFSVIAVQNETYAQRFERLGADPEQVVVTGSIKFDQVTTDRNNAQTKQLRRAFGLTEHDVVFVAGSTHAPEEECVLETWGILRQDHPDLRLILAPRHKERFEEVARMIEQRGWPLRRRSDRTAQSSNNPARIPITTRQSPVILLDTLGELSACWGLADIAYVGGSLNQRGGQNMIEPAAYGAAVLFGPNTWNFRSIVEQLLKHDAAEVVIDGDHMTCVISDLLYMMNRRQAQGRRAQALVMSEQGATTRSLDALANMIPFEPIVDATTERAAA